jgi:outer membrane protein TolC
LTAGLNRPTPRTDIGAAMVAEVPLLNLDAWAGRRAARAAADAESAREQWSATGVELEVIRSYFGAVLAREQARVLAAADLAGQAHVRRAENALANGLVTRSDLLLAQVRLGDIATQRLRADADAMLARQQLALVLGTPNDTAGALPSRIPGLATREIAGSGTRAALSAMAAMVNAATQEAARRSLALLPRVNGFGRYEWHDASSPLAGKPMWTVGVMATWAPFSGAPNWRSPRGRANATAAQAGLAAAQGAAALELASAESGVRVAEQALAIATRGTAQAAEAHRIVVRKYDGGLATVAELLDAQATDLGAQLGEAKARHDLIVAIATVARLRGSDLSLLAQALDASATNPE